MHISMAIDNMYIPVNEELPMRALGFGPFGSKVLHRLQWKNKK
jgi:hypothetical protein